MTDLKSLDTDFAAAMMARGARLVGWEKSLDGRKLYWRLTDIDPQWMDDYRKGADGIVKYMQNRKMLVNIAKTEIITNQNREKLHDDQSQDHDKRRP